MKLATSLEKLFEEYDIVRAKSKQADSDKRELAEAIKDKLEKGKLDEVDTPSFTCAYKFEKDKDVVVFDEEKFAEKEPKKYKEYQTLMKEMEVITKKYTKKTTVKGARKLIVTRKNEGEE